MQIHRNFSKSIPVHPTLLEFLVEPVNLMAYQIAQSLANNESLNYNPIVFYGPTNSGKSHIMQAIRKNLEKKLPENSIVYWKGDEFEQTYTKAMRHRQYQMFREMCRSCQFFFLDGLQFLHRKEKIQTELLFTMNELEQKSSRIILSSRDMDGFVPPLFNRLQKGLCLKLYPLSQERIAEYCKERCKNFHVTIEEEVLANLWERSSSSFGEFKIWFYNLVLFLSSQKPQPRITPSILKEIPFRQKKKIDLQEILLLVSQHFQLPYPEKLCESNGTRSLVIPRYMAISLAKLYLKMDMEELAKCFGNRGISTIFSAIKKVTEDPNLQQIFSSLCQQLEQIENHHDRTSLQVLHKE